MNRRALAALLALAFVLACFAFWPETAGAEEPMCQPLVAGVAESTAEAEKLGGEVKVLKDEQAAKYLAIINATPPKTTLKADMIMLLIVPNRGAVIGLVEGENVCIAGHVGSAVHYRAWSAATGKDT